MRIYGMQVNHLVNPLGFDLGAPTFSYKVKDTAARQARAARLRVYGPAGDSVYDSGLRADLDSLGFTPQLTLSPRTRYAWQVTVEADTGETADSPLAWFETAKQSEPWQGQWISAAEGIENARLFTRFTLPGQVKSARLYICGLGLYEAYVNGQKAGDEYLAPFCNNYDAWLQYQTYDVTDLLAEENELSVLLGVGWYMGRFGFQGQRAVYGDTEALLCELRVTLADGSERVIASDLSWQGAQSGVRFANIYDGETFDAGFQGAPQPVRPAPGLDFSRPRARLSPPVRIMHTLRPAHILHTPAGETVLDLGQEITGWLTFRAAGERGHRYTLSYGEILQDGCFYRDNLRTAQQAFRYISDGAERWARPHFTFFGFRYVKLEGFGEAPDPHDFVGCVLYSDMEQTAFVTTGSEKVNRLAENVLWGQRGNFLDVPTDCPQRDERMGWTGDAQAFCATALYQMDAAAFYDKFLYDMETEQRPRGGAVPHVIPSFHMPGSPSCAWADAAAILPWTVYLFTGDRALLRRRYENMRLWVEWLYQADERTGGRRLWQAGAHFADWLALDAAYPASCTGGTDPDFIACAFYLYSTRLTRQAAEALGLSDDADRYRRLEEEILQAIRREYRTAGGQLALRTQTAYILCLYLGLMPPEDTPRLKAGLDRAFENSRGELRTGFVGTSYLCRVLTACGFDRLAYSLFLREEYPGWLYEVNMGATTVWERWNSVLPDGHVSDTGMNSLNHYAYGAVMEWLFRDAAGIAPVAEAPGFRRALLQPHPDPRLGTLDFRYESAMGRYRSAWQVTGERAFDWQITVPFGAEADLVLPAGTVTGDPAPWRAQNGHLTCTVGAGSYAFHVVCDAAPWGERALDIPLETLMAYPALKERILACAPGLSGSDLTRLTPRQLRSHHFNPLPVWEQKQLARDFSRKNCHILQSISPLSVARRPVFRYNGRRLSTQRRTPC